MFERFTDRARRVVVLAQEEARMLNHNYIGTEHILLGLIHEGDGVAARVLDALDVARDAARDQVEEIIGRGEDTPSGHIPFTPRAKKVLELSLRESLQLGHNYIGTEHILLGLIREGEGVGAMVLIRLGAGLDDVRAGIVDVLGSPATATGHVSGGGSARRWFRRRRPETFDPSEEWVDPSEEWIEPPASPFEQFDDGAWDVLIAARRSARRRADDAIGTRDLLVAVAAVPGPGRDALGAAGIDDAEHATFGEPTDSDAEPSPAALPFTDAARDALHDAVDEAQRRDNPAAGTAHILHALLLRPDERLLTLLEELNVTVADLHAETARRLAA
ncbi:hypothetical protein BH23ACT10_BH23ACT10_02370 [soil metagenome]